ncbi:MAG: cation:proton antiporter [Prochloraceae cyanobacterium]
MLSFSNVFSEIAALLTIATIFGTLALWLRQPLMIAFIAVGVVAGPAGLDLVAAGEQLELLAELGITVLLFVVGLKLDPHEIETVGPAAVIAGVGQIVMTGAIGYAIAIFLGIDLFASFYIAVGLTFSSTIVVIKLLSDKKEIDALHSRIAVGILIVQDIVVVLVTIALSAFNGSNQSSIGQTLLMVILKAICFLLILWPIDRYLLPRLLRSLAYSTELLLIFAITWAIGLAAIADALEFSKEVGAIVAGISLASTPYRVIISSRLVSLQDFLLLFFFINLGIHIDVTHLGDEIGPALIFSAFVSIGKPIMLMSLLGIMGYRKYTSARVSFSLSQISEFSLILATLGVSLGHISTKILGLITLIGTITMGLSTYAIIYSNFLYKKLSPWLSIFERKIPHREETLNESIDNDLDNIDVILFGLGRYGGSILEYLQRTGLVVLGIDFDPEAVRFWRDRGVKTLYGDAEDPELAAALPLKNNIHWAIVAIPGKKIGLTLLHTLKQNGYKGRIALNSHDRQDLHFLEKAGADLVLFPFRDAAREAAHIIVKSIDDKYLPDDRQLDRE